MESMYIYYLVFFLAGMLIVIFYIVERYFLRYDCQPDEIHFAVTEDGKKIALYRYYNKDKKSQYYPVILCHGYTANRHNFDLCKEEEGSLPQYLKRNGFDVWILELRGRGLSSPPRWFSFKDYNWDFRHYLMDARAAISYIMKNTKLRKVAWIGHSMGGMIGYAMAIEKQPLVSLIAIGSPVDFRYMTIPRFLAKGFIKLYLLPVIHFGFFMRIFGPILSIYPFKKIFIFANVRNIPYLKRVKLINSVFNNVTRDETRDFARGAVNGSFSTVDGSLDLKRDFHKISKNLPVFFLAAEIDTAAPPKTIEWAYENLKSKKKLFKVYGKKFGHSLEYGHSDILLTNTAYKEVYPDILQWMKETAKKKKR